MHLLGHNENVLGKLIAEPIRMVRPLWCGRYGAATMVCTIRCGDSMALVFYGARQYGAMVRRIFLLFGIFGGQGLFFELNVSNATNYYIYTKSMLETIAFA